MMTQRELLLKIEIAVDSNRRLTDYAASVDDGHLGEL